MPLQIVELASHSNEGKFKFINIQTEIEVPFTGKTVGEWLIRCPVYYELFIDGTEFVCNVFNMYRCIFTILKFWVYLKMLLVVFNLIQKCVCFKSKWVSMFIYILILHVRAVT